MGYDDSKSKPLTATCLIRRATRKRALDQTGLAASITSFKGDRQAFHSPVLLVPEPQANIGSVGPLHYASQE